MSRPIPGPIHQGPQQYDAVDVVAGLHPPAGMAPTSASGNSSQTLALLKSLHDEVAYLRGEVSGLRSEVASSHEVIASLQDEVRRLGYVPAIY